MNFLVDRVAQATAVPVPLGRFLAQRATFGLAVFVLAIEFGILWQLLNPLELFLIDPADDPRPEVARAGLLRRF